MSASALTAIGNLLPALHRTDSMLTGASSNAAITADLVWFSKKEVLRWFDESLKHIARKALLFARRDTSTVLVAGTAAYATPARHLATLYAAHSDKSLRPDTTAALELRDTQYATRSGTSERFYEDKGGANIIGLYPVPTAGDVGAGALEIIQSEWPAEIDELESNVTMPVPLVIADYLECRVLSEAYRKESDAQLPEVAEQLSQLAMLIEGVIVGYWGENQ